MQERMCRNRYQTLMMYACHMLSKQQLEG